MKTILSALALIACVGCGAERRRDADRAAFPREGAIVRYRLDGRTGMVSRSSWHDIGRGRLDVRFLNTNSGPLISTSAAANGSLLGGSASARPAEWTPYVVVSVDIREVDVISR